MGKYANTASRPVVQAVYWINLVSMDCLHYSNYYVQSEIRACHMEFYLSLSIPLNYVVVMIPFIT